MQIVNRNHKMLAVWMYVPGLLMIFLGASIVLFPRFLPGIVAGCFILAGLMLIQSMRSLRKAVKRIRTQMEFSGDQTPEHYPAALLPHRVYTSWIN